MARAKEKDHEMNYTARSRRIFSSRRQAKCTLTWTSTTKCLPRGSSRPDRLSAEFGPLFRFQRRTVEQIVDSVSGLPILDALVPRMAPDWVQDPILQRLREQLLMNDTEQEIEVPKISSTSCPLRAVLAATQMAEQLVEVPVVFPAECVLNVPLPQVGDELLEVPNVVSQSVEQTVDIPVHGGVKRARRGFHGSVPGQSSTASCRGGP